MSKRDVTKKRATYKPFEYPQAYDFFQKQQSMHWLPTKIPTLQKDVDDFRNHLTESERGLIKKILQGSFVSAEILIGDYWTKKVAKWFKKPEIQIMASTFASFEAIHTVAYAYLLDTLNIADYEIVYETPSASAKLNRLMDVKGDSKQDIMRSLAIFSAFAEGVSLFSQFAILMNFARYNKMPALGQIVSWSSLDESLHSDAGIWLFNTMKEENLELWTDDLKKDIYDAARLTVELEDASIDHAFADTPIDGLTAAHVKNYIRNRANERLAALGLKKNWKSIDPVLLSEMMWFERQVFGTSSTDFFALTPTEYTTGTRDWTNLKIPAILKKYE